MYQFCPYPVRTPLKLDDATSLFLPMQLELEQCFRARLAPEAVELIALSTRAGCSTFHLRLRIGTRGGLETFHQEEQFNSIIIG